jgi:murein DD-endopeptidase MepM/ murein hydrolase activator NlpD
MATPYTGKIYWMHWMGDAVGENDIRQLVATVKKYSPNVDGIVVKSSDGPLWAGARDSKKLLAVSGLQALQTWVAELDGRGLEPHLWATVRGQHSSAEANLVIQASKVAGVRSLILDVHSSDWYGSGLKEADAANLVERIRQGVGNDFHLGLAFDPRGDYPTQIYLDAWAPHVNSLHPRIWHWNYSEGQRGPEPYIDEAFNSLGHYNLPLVPMLQTQKDPATGARVPENDVYDAGTYAFKKGAVSVSYWRLGAAGPLEFRGVSRVREDGPMTASEPERAATTPTTAAPPPAQPAPVPVSQPSQPVQPEPEETETWVVMTNNLNVRTEAGLEARFKVAGNQLSMGQQVEVRPSSIHDDEGYTWVQLDNGYWTAAKTSSGSEVYMKRAEEVAAAPPPSSASEPPAPQPQPEPEDDGKKMFMVVAASLRVRDEPSTAGNPIEPSLKAGAQFEVDPNSRTEANGLVWWKHDKGWSAEKTTSGSEIFLMEYKPGVPMETPWKFAQLPVGLDVMQWFYYFGNTIYAFNNGKRWNYDGYSQGLHGGLDLGHPGGATVYAGVEGIFDGPGRAFGPNRVDVLVGDYRIIYGHLGSPANYPKGSRITPDMPVGKVETSLQHLHLEIRFQQATIVNPLLFIEKETRDGLMARFPPNGQFGFYSSPRWNKWLTPFDQPTIVVGGPVIGPRAS